MHIDLNWVYMKRFCVGPIFFFSGMGTVGIQLVFYTAEVFGLLYKISQFSNTITLFSIHTSNLQVVQFLCILTTVCSHYLFRLAILIGVISHCGINIMTYVEQKSGSVHCFLIFQQCESMFVCGCVCKSECMCVCCLSYVSHNT